MDDGSNQRDIIPNTYDAQQSVGAVRVRYPPCLIVNFLYEMPFFRNTRTT